jgi:hypothetical protein
MFTATITTMSISGELIFDNGTFLSNCTNVNFNGNIKYRGREPFQLFLTTNAVNIQNPDTITFTELEGNETITHIISNWQLNNTNQYPSPTNVKKDIPYAWGELVGTYQQPPESVVLKDYVYDNGEMIGTLDLPQAPTTSDIVTAIKNDSDLGGKISTTNTNVGNISTAITTIDGKVDIVDANVDTLISRLTSVLTQRLGQSVTVEILQQILTAHLNN